MNHEIHSTRIKKRVLDHKDYLTVSSALGEIRAYGYLLEAGIKATAISEKNEKPPLEFNIEIDRRTNIVEVHSKQMNGTESRTMENYYETLFNQSVAGLKTHTNIPFGRPKGDESISKLCGIKAIEHQFDSDVISILWLDYQDEIWDAVFNESNVYPLNSFRGSVRSTQLRTTLLQTC